MSLECHTPKATSTKTIYMSTQEVASPSSSNRTSSKSALYNTSLRRRSAAYLISASMKKKANKYFTKAFPSFIQIAVAIDGAPVCAKLVSMIHDKPQVQSDPHIVCQIDFVNAFQALNCQLDTNDCILGKASRTYGEENVQIGDELPHLPSLKPFFAYFRSMNQVASHNRFTDHEGFIQYIKGTKGGQQGDPLEMLRFCLTNSPPNLGPHTRQTLADARNSIRRRGISHGPNPAHSNAPR